GVSAASAGLARIGKFQLMELLGCGAFGNVYKAWDSDLERVVALKVPRAGVQESDRFIKEARSAARLQHPNIVALHEAGQFDGTCYIASEFVAGTPPAERGAHAPFPPPEAPGIVANAAQRLPYPQQHAGINTAIQRTH